MLNKMRELKDLRGWDRMGSEARRLLYKQKYNALPWYLKIFTKKPL
jgi:hypothetical protein